VHAASLIDSEMRDIEQNATAEEREANEVATTADFREYRRRYRAARNRVVVLAVRAEEETVLNGTRAILQITDDLAYKPTAVRREEAQARRPAGLPVRLFIYHELDEAKITVNRHIGALLRDLYSQVQQND
jgi:hypothetical protein